MEGGSDLGGDHLIFSADDVDSEGSDYQPLDASKRIMEEDASTEVDNESINSENYDMEIDTCPESLSYMGRDGDMLDKWYSDSADLEERIAQTVNVAFDPPKRTNCSEMSVETLKGLIQQHRQTRTVRDFLCSIDTESDHYDACYSDISEDHIPSSSDDMEPNEKVLVTRYLLGKTYRTMLGFACVDQDGERGEAKIKSILQTAKCLLTDMRTFLAVFNLKHLKRKSRHDPWEEITKCRECTTPLRLLIDNHHATKESLRMVCNAWPRVIYVRGEQWDRPKTALMHLTYSCSDFNEIERLKAFSGVLFEAAEKTKEGARGLVLASDTINKGVDDYYGEETENQEEKTVLHIATAYYSNPGSVLPIFLKWWPDGLKHLCEITEAYGDYPFHSIFKSCKTYESLVKSIEAFLEYSTLDALATGFLYNNIRDGFVFDLFRQAIEPSEVDRAQRYHGSLNADETWQLYLCDALDRLLQKRDEHGRSFLHIIAAYTIIEDDIPSERGYAVIRQMRKEYESEGREFPLDVYWNPMDDEDISEELSIEILQWWKKRQMQTLAKAGEIAEWILSKNESLALVGDNDTLNPLQYAVSVGKPWHGGLDAIAGLVPGWAQPLGNGSLCPFAIAASSGDDLDTVFELLRFDPFILEGISLSTKAK